MALCKRNLRNLINDQRGTTAVMFGMTIVPAIMLVGGAVDFGIAYKSRQTIQSAADAGALAGASMGATATPAAREALAKSVFNANLNGITAVTPTATATSTTVAVTATKGVPTAFLKVAHINTISVSGSSNAAVIYSTTTSSAAGRICLLALDPASLNGFHAQGTPNIQYTNCWAHTNSTQASAINGGGNASVVGAGHCAVGGVSQAGGVYSPVPIAGCSVVADPFATVSAYATSGTYTTTFATPTISSTCKASNLNLKKGTYTLQPGRYCGGINLQAQANVTFLPGEYIIDNGVFNVQSGSSVSGSNVLFYYSGVNAYMTIIGGGTVNLKGRATGSSYAGFLMIGAKAATHVSNIQGGGTFNMEGMIYLPMQTVYVTGNGDANGSSNVFAMVARDFDFRGNGIFRMKTYNSASNMPDILPVKPAVTTSGIASVKLN